jgi:hypothetical protein
MLCFQTLQWYALLSSESYFCSCYPKFLTDVASVTSYGIAMGTFSSHISIWITLQYSFSESKVVRAEPL